MNQLVNCKNHWAGRTFFSLVLISSAQLLAVHPFHISTAEMEFNAKSGRFEVALRLQVADLERVVEQLAGKRVDLETPAAEKIIIDYLSHNFYIANAVSPDSPDKIANGKEVDPKSSLPKNALHANEAARDAEGESQTEGGFKRPVAVVDVPLPPKTKVRLLGKEFETSWTWLYFEIDAPSERTPDASEPANLVFVNRVLMDINSGQINTCTIRYGNQRQSLKMSNTQTALDFDRQWMQPSTVKSTVKQPAKATTK